MHILGQKCEINSFLSIKLFKNVVARSINNPEFPVMEPFENEFLLFKNLKRHLFIYYLLKGESKKKQLLRCHSHNAFKCFGDCGTKDCNTHFQTEEGLKEHISKNRSVCLEVNNLFWIFYNLESNIWNFSCFYLIL